MSIPLEKVGVTQKVFVFDKNGKFLIVRRTKTAPSKPGAWDLPGGGIDFGEDPIGAMNREIREETGLEVDDLEVIDLTSKINEVGEFWITIAYRAKSKSKTVKLSYEHDQCKWVDIIEFPQFTDSKRFLRFSEKLK